MLARRHENENAIYEQQQAAAAKPLNQGVKGLAPKTPGNKPPKTPFGKNKNDENATLPLGDGAKEGKTEKLERNAFVTPANPRTRAPLGNKTTNGRALKTPAPLLVTSRNNEDSKLSSIKPISPRLRRSKIKVHESTSVDYDVLSKDAEECEIEYMPPRGEPLPENYDDIWPADRTYPMLEGDNLVRGWWAMYAPDRHKTDDDPDLSDYEEKLTKCEEMERKEAEMRNKSTARTTEGSSRLASKPAPPMSKARDAASALSNRSTKTSTALSSRTATKARQPTKVSSSAAKKPLLDKGNPRFTAAKAASNSTIGYSKGRVMSAHRRPLADIHSKPPVKPAEPERTSLDRLLAVSTLDTGDENTDLGFTSTRGAVDLFEDDEPEVFQLDTAEDL